MKSIDIIAQRKGSPRRRQLLSKTVYVLVISLSLLTAVPLLSILLDLVRKGWRHFNLVLFTQSSPLGILNGIIGTFMMLLIATILSIPMGLLAGIFLSEKRDTKLANLVRTLTDILQGVPSIVWGIVVYMLVVKTMHTYSAVAGGVALGMMMIPMIIRSTEEGLRM
ncbi:ABC transporter permease subunit, partial [uncultured Porphyromonas sp.]|uniref:ABC transporter permease subunit n=1 Tax=uncultured Porphyromonas sp. TaxID=159274 RepID=UPI00262D4C5B